MSGTRSRQGLLGFFVAAFLASSAVVPLGAQELGLNRGIDHLANLVRPENFEDSAEVFSSQLGFAVTPALLSPLGAKNRLIWFADHSYFEIVTITEENEFTAPFLDFLAEHEGGKYFGAEVTDVASAGAFLNGSGYPAVGPIPAPPLTIEETGDVLGLSPLWYSLILTTTLAPDNSLFFLDYDEAELDQSFADFPSIAPSPHPNTARKIDTVWLVVADLDAAIDFYQGLGLDVRGRHQKIHYLGGRGAEVDMGNATLALLEPDGPGIVARFAAERGEGILGASVEVRNLSRALRFVNHNADLHLRTFKYKGRDRFLIPAGLTNGFLLEMVED